MPLLDAATYLECEKAKDIISNYIFQKLNLKNYLFYYKLTKLYHMESLRKFLCNMILQHYLVKEDLNSLYELKIQEFSELLSYSELRISSELELFNAAVDWINYKPKERSEHMNGLLKLIRLPLLSDKILTDVIKAHKLCKHCINCKSTIKKAIKNKKNCTDKTSNIQFQSRYYNCQFESNQVMMVGGITFISGIKSCLETASLYILDRNSLMYSMTTRKMQKQRNDCKTAVIGSKVYCFGSTKSDGKELKSCEVYCRKSDNWTSIASFPGDNIIYCCVCSFMNKIYVFGDLFCCNWVYDPTENSWKRIKNCNKMRYSASCTVFQGQCAVIGGTSNDNLIMKSVETYDHYLDKWSFLANMQQKRYDAGVVTKGNRFYVIGGFRNHTCEVYDSISKKFTFIANTKLHASGWLSSVILGSNIVVHTANTIHEYDIKENKWLQNDYESSVELNNFNNSCVKLHKYLE